MNADDETTAGAAERTDPAIEPAVHAPPAIEHTAPVAGPEKGFTDTLTLAFADPAAAVFGVVALERGPSAAVGALLFADGKQVVSHARADLPTDLPHWQDLRTDALWVETGPAAWTVELRGDDAQLSVEFIPLADAFGYGSETGPAQVTGIERSERLCRVAGAATIAGRELQIDARGQRSHQWGPHPWPVLARWRSLAVWLDDGPSLAAWAVKPAGAAEHDREAVAALLAAGDPPRPVAVDEPRISMTYDAGGGPLRAGLELWIGAEDPVARRAAGEVIGTGTLELGASRQQWSLMDWHMDGRDGVGALAITSPGGAGAAA